MEPRGAGGLVHWADPGDGNGVSAGEDQHASLSGCFLIEMIYLFIFSLATFGLQLCGRSMITGFFPPHQFWLLIFNANPVQHSRNSPAVDFRRFRRHRRQFFRVLIQHPLGFKLVTSRGQGKQLYPFDHRSAVTLTGIVFAWISQVWNGAWYFFVGLGGMTKV